MATGAHRLSDASDSRWHSAPAVIRSKLNRIRGVVLKSLLLLSLLCLSGCSWFHAKKPVVPDSPELMITGAPTGSMLFIDGLQVRPATEAGNRPQILRVAPGTHTVEVHSGERVAYRENLDVQNGEKRVVTVLSGAGRD